VLKLNKYYYFAQTGMKKLAAILLLGIFVFNLFGYKLLVSFMVNNANQSLEAALDKQKYNEDDLITIKKAIHLPYYNNTKDFTRSYGEVEMNGVLYKYVKSRIYNDSLEMLCIPNISKQQILQSKDNFTQAGFDLQKETNKKATGSGKLISFVKLLSEYVKHSEWNTAGSCTTTIALQNTSYYNANSGSLHKATIEQPPDTFNS